MPRGAAGVQFLGGEQDAVDFFTFGIGLFGFVLFPGKGHIAAEGDQGEAIVGFAAPELEEFGACLLYTSQSEGGGMTEMTLDTMDRRILDIIQTDFPLESRPYAIIAERLGITEQEALDRVNALRKSRLIRRLGAN